MPGRNAVAGKMNRWNIKIYGLNQDPSTLHATPVDSILTEYVIEAVRLLQAKIATKEEELIFRGSSTLALERIRDCCIKLLSERADNGR